MTVDDNGRVIELSLEDNQLSGSIPPELGDLANLQFLDFDDNQLNGPMPPELGNLANLGSSLARRKRTERANTA